MGRVKGCVVRERCRDVEGSHCVEEIPKTAISGEAMVLEDKGTFEHVLLLDDKLPSYLIGKRVSFIIVPEED
jgi:hypothetical protein